MKSKQNDLILRTKDFHSMISERKAFEMSYIRWNTVFHQNINKAISKDGGKTLRDDQVVK